MWPQLKQANVVTNKLAVEFLFIHHASGVQPVASLVFICIPGKMVLVVTSVDVIVR